MGSLVDSVVSQRERLKEVYPSGLFAHSRKVLIWEFQSKSRVQQNGFKDRDISFSRQRFYFHGIRFLIPVDEMSLHRVSSPVVNILSYWDLFAFRAK